MNKINTHEMTRIRVWITIGSAMYELVRTSKSPRVSVHCEYESGSGLLLMDYWVWIAEILDWAT